MTTIHLRHSSFSNPSFASPTSQALHLRHLASRPWSYGMIDVSIPEVNKLKNSSTFAVSVLINLFSLNWVLYTAPGKLTLWTRVTVAEIKCKS